MVANLIRFNLANFKHVRPCLRTEVAKLLQCFPHVHTAAARCRVNKK